AVRSTTAESTLVDRPEPVHRWCGAGRRFGPGCPRKGGRRWRRFGPHAPRGRGPSSKGREPSRPGAVGVFSDLAVTWAARTEESGGRTSPEELLAAAHAACYAMALSHELAQKGQFADSLQIQAQCAFAERLGGGFAVS